MHMTPTVRPLLKPILGLSAAAAAAGASSLLFTASLSQKSSLATTTKMSTSTPSTYPIKPYTPRPWQYIASDFTRQDPTRDSAFYSAPRFVTHIDDMAIASLREYYAAVLPTQGRILDFCSSWISHYPESFAGGEGQGKGKVKVTGMGMNKAELDANKVLNGGRVVCDLNDEPDVRKGLVEAGVVVGDGDGGGGEEGVLFDAATNVVSIDYLTKPVEVLRSLRGVVRKGGRVHLVVSNRCFPTKAIGRWLRVDEGERLQMVGDFLHRAGWSTIEIVTLSDGTVEGGRQGGMQALMASLGMGRRDPLWVVRAVNE